MSASANDRVSLSFFFLILSTGTLVVVIGESVTVTSPINITRADVDYYWYNALNNTPLPCDETDLSNNNCTFQFQNTTPVLLGLAVLHGKGFTATAFTLNATMQPQGCDCTSVYANVSSNVTLVKFGKGCPCNGSYLNQFTSPVCDASGNITQAPLPYYYGNDTNVTFTCHIDIVKIESVNIFQWTFYNSSSFKKKLLCHEPATSARCTVPGPADFAKASVQCVAFTLDTAAPCIKSAINFTSTTTSTTTPTITFTSTTTSGTAPLGNDLGLYMRTLLAWFVVSATWF